MRRAAIRLKRQLLKAWKRLRGGELGPRRAGLSVAVGLFVGLCPAYGLHSLLIVALCLPLRLDAALAVAASMISNPVTFPLLLSLQAHLGAALLAEPVVELSELSVVGALSQVGLGALLTATVAALIGGAAAGLIVARTRRSSDPSLSEPQPESPRPSLPTLPATGESD